MSERPNKRTVFVDSVDEARNYNLKTQSSSKNAASTTKAKVTEEKAMVRRFLSDAPTNKISGD